MSILKEALEKDYISYLPNDVVYNTLLLAKNILRTVTSTSYSSSKCVAIAELKYLLLEIENLIAAKELTIKHSNINEIDPLAQYAPTDYYTIKFLKGN